MAEVLPSRSGAASHILTDKLEKPSLDDRSYRVLELANKLEALIIHDPETDKASAAMDVNVGSFSDEDDMPGMAHAVEHLLFMGTKKYPKENEYSSFLSNNSGYSNAFTASTSTNYYFEVSAHSGVKNSDGSTGKSSVSPLHGALDRFAQFFIEPLFLEETLDRELQAVDSENKKNLQSDTWRLMQLQRSLANPKHPYSKFSTGSLKTLKDDPQARGVKIRDEFMRFHAENYSANRMKLVVLGRESLETLQEWVEGMFSGVVNKNLPQNRWDGIPPFTSNELQTESFAVPVMNTRDLTITFPYQDEDSLYDTNPGSYLTHLIGHEGPGSVLSYVKDKGWANSLSAGYYTLCPGSGLLSVAVSLTEEGLKRYQEVVKVIFQYISILRQSEPQSWIFEEMGKMSEVDFKFRQKSPASDTTSNLSGRMQRPLPRDRLLSGSLMHRKFDSDGIRSALKYLDVEKFKMMITAQGDLPGETKKEKWYGTEYVVKPIPEESLAELRKAASSSANERPKELFLPGKNEFIPSRLEVERKEVAEPAKIPKLIRNDTNVRVWFKKDDQFWVPKASFQVTLRNPVIQVTPRNAVLGVLCEYLVDDTLVEYVYDADLAGLAYSFSVVQKGIKIGVSGYNDKIPVLLEKVLKTIRDLEIREDRFEILKERLVRAYKNMAYRTPYRQIGSYFSYIAYESSYMPEHYLAEAESITLEEVRHFQPLLFRQTHIETFTHGNLYREDALKLTDLVETTIQTRPLPADLWPIRRGYILPPGSNYIWSYPLKDPSNINHCIEYTLQVGAVTDRPLCTRLCLLAQMTDEPAFDQLRTKEQLGYVVFSGSTTTATYAGYYVLIQSERTPEYLESRVDSFLLSFRQKLEIMTPDEFDAHKTSIINRKLQKLENLSQEKGRLWGHISGEYFNFQEHEEDVELIRGLTKEDIVAFYDEFISPASPTRAKLSIHMVAQGKAPAADTPEQRAETLGARISEGLAAQGLTGDVAKLTTRLKAVDIAAGDQEGVTNAISSHMSEDLAASDEQVSAFKAQAPELLPALGVAAKPEPKDAAAAEVNGDSAYSQHITKPTIITDVRAWKASLQLSSGPRAIRELSEFEDFDAKL